MMNDATTATRRLAGLPEPEPLHPDLAAYLVRRPGRLPSLEHPLIVQAPYIPPLASYVNGLYDSLSKRADALLESRAYDRWLEMHSRTHQLGVLLERGTRMDHGTWWELLASLFRRELPWFDDEAARWSRAIGADRPSRRRFMTNSEGAAFDQLPDLVDVWRAEPTDRPGSGFSFFRDESGARTFAATARNRLELQEGTFSLFTARLNKADVIALCNSRGMTELLAPPAKAVGEAPIGTC
ncbi:MAG: hypothetical protein ABI794_01090 [Betaproteobacteria bacterium]